MTSSTRYLPFFVYGTLMPGQDNEHLWQGQIVDQVEATFFAGALYSFDYFPMLIERSDESGPVRGMLITINHACYDEILRAIDALEEYDPAAEDQSLYRRQARQVVLADGNEQTAWVYLGRPELVVGRPRIDSGDWTTARPSPFAVWWQANGHRLMSGQKINSDS